MEKRNKIAKKLLFFSIIIIMNAMSINFMVKAMTPQIYGLYWNKSNVTCYVPEYIKSKHSYRAYSQIVSGLKAWNFTNAPRVSIGNESNADITVDMDNYGNVNWDGLTDNYSSWGRGPLDSSYIRINRFRIGVWISSTDVVHALTAHEMGHALGLDHNLNEDSIMSVYTTDYYNYRGSSPRYLSPRYADIQGINAIYN